MWESIKKLFTGKKEVPLNPEIFHNDLAYKISWEPLKKGGAQFKNVNLVKESSQQLTFKSTKSRIIFNALITGLPIVLFIVFPIFGIIIEELSGMAEFPGVLFPVIILILGSIGLYNSLIPNVFDKRLGLYYKSFKKPDRRNEAHNNKNWIPLEQIKALQIIEEKVRTKNSSYKSYELNLVFDNGSRYNVIDHGGYEAIKTNAKTIADFLEIPYFDAIAPYTYEPKASNIGSSSYTEKELDAPYDSTKSRRM